MCISNQNKKYREDQHFGIILESEGVCVYVRAYVYVPACTRMGV